MYVGSLLSAETISIFINSVTLKGIKDRQPDMVLNELTSVVIRHHLRLCHFSRSFQGSVCYQLQALQLPLYITLVYWDFFGHHQYHRS
jgi:hypothetical protein